MTEEWKDYRWGYQASNQGRVRSPKGAILTPRGDRAKPAVKLIGYDGVPRTYQVGVIVLSAFGSPRKSRAQIVMFRDGNPKNCAIGNLYWGRSGRKFVQEDDISSEPISWNIQMAIRNAPDKPSAMEFVPVDLVGIAPKHIQDRVQSERTMDMEIYHTWDEKGRPQIIYGISGNNANVVTLPIVKRFYE